jgi:dTDP-4-amino-4,6-dideoxygalactose transaminase
MKDQRRESSYHLFALRIKHINESQRDQIVEEIVSRGVMVNVHFIPMPMLTYFKSIGYQIDNYPNSYKQYACEISLPIYPQLTETETDYVIASVIASVRLVTGIEELVKVSS